MIIELNGPVNLFSLVGICVDLIGVLFLFTYGLPSKMITARGPSIIGEFTKEKENEITAKNRKIKRGSNIGLTLVLSGFIFQLLGVIFKTT